MNIETIIGIVSVILSGAISTFTVYINLERKVTISNIKIGQIEKEVDFLKEESKENKMAIQNALIEIQKSIHSIELKFEQMKQK